MPTFQPGYDAHWIQTRLAFESSEDVELAPLVTVDADTNELVVKTKAGERRYWCSRTADAATHLDRAMVVPGGHLVFLNERRGLLALLVGDPGAPPPRTLGLVAGVSELEDSAAVAVPTTDEHWSARLYCIRLPDDRHDSASDDHPAGQETPHDR